MLSVRRHRTGASRWCRPAGTRWLWPTSAGPGTAATAISSLGEAVQKAKAAREQSAVTAPWVAQLLLHKCVTGHHALIPARPPPLQLCSHSSGEAHLRYRPCKSLLLLVCVRLYAYRNSSWLNGKNVIWRKTKLVKDKRLMKIIIPIYLLWITAV